MLILPLSVFARPSQDFVCCLLSCGQLTRGPTVTFMLELKVVYAPPPIQKVFMLAVNIDFSFLAFTVWLSLADLDGFCRVKLDPGSDLGLLLTCSCLRRMDISFSSRSEVPGMSRRDP